MVDLNRRKFLQSGSLGVAAASLPVAAATVTLAQGTALLGEAAAPLAVKTVVKYPFRWWVSHDGETYFDECETREEAVAIAANYRGGALIAECQQQDFDLRIDGWGLYELMQESNSELIGEGDFIDASSEQIDELENAVNAVIAAWAEKHRLNRAAWQFAETRNKEKIEEAMEARHGDTI